MQPLQKRWITAFAVLLTAVSVPTPARAQDAEVVIEWNRIWQAAQATPGAGSPTIFFTRPFAIVHIAMFDALNSIDFIYTPYAIKAHAEANSSREAAAAQASALGQIVEQVAADPSLGPKYTGGWTNLPLSRWERIADEAKNVLTLPCGRLPTRLAHFSIRGYSRKRRTRLPRRLSW